MRTPSLRSRPANRLRRLQSQLEQLEERALLATITGVTLEDVSSELTTSFQRGAIHTIDGSGLAGAQHGNAPDNFMWLNAGTSNCCGDPPDPNGPGAAIITYDLEGNYDLNNLHVWNYNEVNIPTRGANAVEILVADSVGGAFQSLGNFTFNQANGQPTETGQTVDLTSFAAANDVRLVRLNITSSHGGDNGFVGLSEIQFDGSLVPIQGVTLEDVSSELTTSFQRGAIHTIDDSGLTAGLHGNAPDNFMWLNAGTTNCCGDPPDPNGPGAAVITYDLEGTFDLSNLHVWNYNEVNIPTRGANAVEILVADSVGSPFQSLGNFTFNQANGLATEPGQAIDLTSFAAADKVRLVRLDITSSHGGDNGFVGLSEVQFFGVAVPEVPIQGVSVADVSSELTTSFRRGAIHSIDESGLINGQHTSVPDDFMWLSAGNGCCADPADPNAPGAVITYDLGANYDLEDFHVWNYNEVNLPSRGANSVEILVSDSDSGPFQSLGNFTFDQATGLNDYEGQRINLSSFGAADDTRMIRLNIISNHGDGNSFAGLSEVQFFGEFIPPVPIPGVTIEDVSSELVTSFRRGAIHAIDDSGLSNGQHSLVPDDFMWLNAGNGCCGDGADPNGTGAVITFDLEGNYDLDNFNVWNYNEGSPLLTNRGANAVEIFVASSVNGNFQSLGNFTFAQADGTSSYEGETFDLTSFAAADNTRLIRFDISSNHGDGNSFIGLSEVDFFGEELTRVPIPNVTLEDVSSELTNSFRRGAIHAIDESGLTGSAHTSIPDDFMWLNAGNGCCGDPADPNGLGAVITFDLEGNYDLDDLHVWNYNEAAANLSSRGANAVEILVADSFDGAFTSLGNFTFARASGLNDYAGETIDLSSFADADDTRLIRLNITSNHGDTNNFIGLSEIQFFGTFAPPVPIPNVTVDDVSSNLAGFDRLAVYTTDDSGLTNGEHNVVPDGNMWLSQGTFGGTQDPHITAGDGLIAHITYDLDGLYDLSGLNIWNYNEFLPNRSELLGRGVRGVEIFVGDSASGPFTSAGTMQMPIADGTDTYRGDFISLAHLSALDSAAFIRLDVQSNHGGDASFAGLSEIQFFGDLIANTDPVADAGGPYDIVEGAELVLDASGSSDIDLDSLTYSWDVNGDGDFSDATGVTPTLDWAALSALVPTVDDDGSFSVVVRADDGAGGSNDAAAALTITNVAPAIAVSGDAAGSEGSNVTLNLGAITDPGNDTVTDWIVNWGDGNTDTFNAGGDVTHAYADDGAYTALVSLTDEDGTYADIATHDFAITNVNPAIVLSGNATVNEASTFTLNLGAITDPGDDTVTDWVVDWGDGSTDTFNAGGDVTHVYDDNGSFTASVSLVDEDGSYADVASQAVTVDNVAPTAAIDGPVEAVPNLATDFDFSATDPSAADQAAGFTFAINWGDGSTDTLGPGAASPSTASHSFGQLGDYTITVTATDKDGGVSSASNYAIEIVPVAKIGNDVFVGGINGQPNRIIVQSAGPDEVFVRYNDRRFGSFDVTPSSLVSIVGGDGTDRISITNCIATDIQGQGGNDIVSAGSCDDTIDGGDGRDMILAGEGNNVVRGGAGNDLIQGRSGDDVFYGGTGNDTLDGGAGSDDLFGDEGNDRITGGGGHDLLSGGLGNDILIGGAGRDVLLGGIGSDWLRGDNGDDLLVGGSGSDSIRGNRGSDVLIDGEAANEGDEVALQAVLLNWSVSHIHDFLGAVNSDADRDALSGGGGLDELFVGSEDSILNNRGQDSVTLI